MPNYFQLFDVYIILIGLFFIIKLLVRIPLKLRLPFFIYDYTINYILLLVFLLLNFFQPMIVDDLARGAIAALYNHTIIQSLLTDYQTWTGRMSAQWLVYVLFNQPLTPLLSPICNMLNTLALTWLYYFGYKICSQHQHPKYYLLFIFIFSAILLKFMLLQTMLWKTVGIQYLWGLVLLLYLYYDWTIGQVKIKNTLLIFCCGLFIGLYNEIYAAIVTVVIAMQLIYSLVEPYFWKLKGFSLVDTYYAGRKKYFIMLLIGNIIGGCILLAAPGNYVRQQILVGNHATTSLIDKGLGLIYQVYYNRPLFALFILCIIVICCNSTLIYKKFCDVLTIILLLAIFLPIGNIGFSERMLMLPIVIFSLVILHHLFSNRLMVNLISGIPTILPLLATIILGLVLFNVYLDVAIFNQERIKLINNFRQQHIANMILPAYKHNNRLIYFDDIVANSTNWRNQHFSHYYKLQSVRTSD